MRHHSFIIEAEAERGIEAAEAWVEHELQIKTKGNPDVVVLRYGLFSVTDARRVSELAAGASFTGEYKVLIISASRAYHEAQNALLKLLEEPPPRTYIFFILPTFGGLLPTFRSRVHILDIHVGRTTSNISEAAELFIKASREKRSAIIKKLTNGKDEEARREQRDEAIALINGIEQAAYAKRSQTSLKGERTALLSDIAVVRGNLYDRSAPVRMILEHLSLVIPKNLL
ncbi:MAG: hypothetical protein WAZ27_04935 [Minisyncoccia bacterium]